MLHGPGIVIVIGGQCFSWNAGLVVGLGSYLLGLLLIGLAYTVLICSMAEMAGALPFSGTSTTCLPSHEPKTRLLLLLCLLRPGRQPPPAGRS